MKRLIFITIALSIPIIIWWIERVIAKRKGEKLKGPSVLMLVGFALAIMIILVGLLISQTENAPEGSKYIPAQSVGGKIVSGEFN